MKYPLGGWLVQGYAVRGWRRGNVYPDFVFAALRDEDRNRIVAVETKGEQLSGNLDTVYKAALLDRLSAAYGTKGQASGGDLAKHRTAIDFQAAVVLFGDTNAKLPLLIHGAEGAAKYPQMRVTPKKCGVKCGAGFFDW